MELGTRDPQVWLGNALIRMTWSWSGRQSYGLVLPPSGQISPYRQISASASVSVRQEIFNQGGEEEKEG